MKLKELRRELVKELKELDLPYLEADLIIEKALGIRREEILLYDRELNQEETDNIKELLDKRLSGVPMAYILGHKEFYGLDFEVNENTLIPRPDTETLVDVAIEKAREFKEPDILDLCTGSGAVASAISYTLKREVFLSDISHEAIIVAKRNYKRLTGFDGIVREGDLFEPWKGESFSIIASNPPYLTPEDLENCSEEVKREPPLALLGGEDGLSVIRRIVKEGKEHLTHGGYLIIEADFREMAHCARLFLSEGYKDIETRKDLSGRERVIYGRRD